MSLLRLENLRVSVASTGTRLVDGLDLALDQGEMLSLVGESGSGKTMAALAVMRLLPEGVRPEGRVMFEGRDIAALDEAGMRALRGGRIGMVFQNPLSALNPTHTVGRQIAETARLHLGADARQAREHTLTLLDEVGIPDPKARIDDYPHQFSGGMRQRVAIAMALACHPRLLIADEPTTALDPLVARQILDLIARLRRRHDMGVLFISHDLSVVREYTDRVQVLYSGRTAEVGGAAAFFAAPHHPYSRALLGAVPMPGLARLPSVPGQPPEPDARPPGCRFAPRCPAHQPDCDRADPPLLRVAGEAGETEAACLHPQDGPVAAAAGPSPQPVRDFTGLGSLLQVEAVSVRYGGAQVLHGIALDIAPGECLGVVGESGSGKSTLGRAVLQMIGYDGRIALDGQDFTTLRGTARRQQRRRIQVVFQDPKESLNPRLTLIQSVAEAAGLAGGLARGPARAEAARLLDRVGLSAGLQGRLPAAISGGQAQRAAIARALAASPSLIVLDEPTSALDVSTQAMLLNLLKDLAQERGLSYLLISHDLAAVSFLADRIAVLSRGRIVELERSERFIAAPRHDYSRALLAAVPQLQTPMPAR